MYSVSYKSSPYKQFLNQALIGHRLVCAWFLEIDSVCDVCMCARAHPQGQ